jgi:hypothetical protein
VNEYNRQLARLMDQVTRGDVWSLHDLVEEYGRPLVTRVLADGFGVILAVDEWSEEAIREALIECRFLPLDETLTLVETVIPDGYWGHEAPGALDFQTDWKILRPYASDDPEAIAEVRRLHAERRESAERQRREWAKQAPRRPL